MVIQDSGFRVDKTAIGLPASLRCPGFAYIVEVSTFRTKYPKEQL
jgi:hypothetical protein